MLITKGVGKDEYYGNFYTFPNCDESHIMGCCNYCPDCGIRLEWPNDPRTIEGYEGSTW